MVTATRYAITNIPGVSSMVINQQDDRICYFSIFSSLETLLVNGSLVICNDRGECKVYYNIINIVMYSEIYHLIETLADALQIKYMQETKHDMLGLNMLSFACQIEWKRIKTV